MRLPSRSIATIAIRKRNPRRRGRDGCECSGQSIVSGNFSTPLSTNRVLGHARIVQWRKRATVDIRGETQFYTLKRSGILTASLLRRSCSVSIWFRQERPSFDERDHL